MPGHDCLSMLKALGGFMEIWRWARCPDVTGSDPTKQTEHVLS